MVLHFRGDCGFGVPDMYAVCERLRVSYTFGLSANAVLQRETEGLLAEAVAAYERERQATRQPEPPRPAVPSRLFTGFWYQAGTWSQPRWVVAKADAPAEALTGVARQRHFRLRRQRDPLGEGHPCTWRPLLIKVAAEVVVSTRRIVVRLSSSWPHLDWYRRVCERLSDHVPTLVPNPSG